jgi:hypothetical protein
VLNDIYSYAQALDAAGGDLFAQSRASAEGVEFTSHDRIVIVRKHEVIVETSARANVGEIIPDTSDELGLCLARVKLADVTAVLTREEVAQHDYCTAADDEMLANAY